MWKKLLFGVVVLGVVTIVIVVIVRKKNISVTSIVSKERKPISYEKKPLRKSGFMYRGRRGTILRKNLPASFKKKYDSKFVRANPPIDPNSLPKSYDMRIVLGSSLGNILDQKDCGSCYAFGAAKTLTDRIHLYDVRNSGTPHLNTTVTLDGVSVRNQLSPYLIAACSVCDNKGVNQDYKDIIFEKGECSQGTVCTGSNNDSCGACSGGVLEYIMNEISNNGMLSLACGLKSGSYRCHNLQEYKDIGSDRQCITWMFKNPKKVSIFEDSELNLNNPEKLSANELTIMNEIYLNGSAIMGYELFQSFYEFFDKTPTGIYRKTSSYDNSMGGHCCVFVGWGEEGGVKYWILANSWGEGWGDKGYFRLLRGENFCSCESDVWSLTPDIPASEAMTAKMIKSGSVVSRLRSFFTSPL